VRRGQRLLGEHVEHGRGHPPARERVDEGGLVDRVAATGVHDDVTHIARRDEETAVLPRGAEDATREMPARGTSETSVLPKIDFGEIDLDVGELSDDSDSAPTARDTMKTEQISQLEPVTMSEVGTKLDLARAYMDMGDPDGARNILQEVLTEGSASQKQEARRLIDSLPGA